MTVLVLAAVVLTYAPCGSGAVQTLGCTSLSAVDPLLGGLEPAYRVAWRLISFPKKAPQSSEYVFGPQGLPGSTRDM